MFALTLWLHSVIRWVIVGLEIVAVYRAVMGQSRDKPWTLRDTVISFGLMLAFDMQIVLGVLLWVFSPITILAIHELDLNLRSYVLPFWAFVHPALMLAAIVVAHVGVVLILRHTEARRRHRTAAVFFGFALLLVLAGVPWPWLPYGRSLFTPFP